MIAPPQALAAPEIGDPALLLAGHQIDAVLDEHRGGKVVAVIAIDQDHVARLQVRHQGAKQRLLPRMLAAAWPQRPTQHRAGR